MHRSVQFPRESSRRPSPDPGDEGNDALWGNSGSDIISGGGGNDEIDGDNPFAGSPPPGSPPSTASTDTCTGGTGADAIFNCERGDASEPRDAQPAPQF